MPEGIGMGVAFLDPTDDQLRILNPWLAERSLTGTPQVLGPVSSEKHCSSRLTRKGVRYFDHHRQ
jgi:hypothetical protein